MAVSRISLRMDSGISHGNTTWRSVSLAAMSSLGWPAFLGNATAGRTVSLHLDRAWNDRRTVQSLMAPVERGNFFGLKREVEK
ncbi:hypothetical protein chiPu_0026885 [Chiloscyllium punctatum]|uniref:Uncharacterized protein n=1 Tax=Chiloscyllium punctatum TaxID=137246 RepID=A0A401TJ95_CHIPU|nr:hypothetical protein [Chiloscyllium punctatum]